MCCLCKVVSVLYHNQDVPYLSTETSLDRTYDSVTDLLDTLKMQSGYHVWPV